MYHPAQIIIESIMDIMALVLLFLIFLGKSK